MPQFEEYNTPPNSVGSGLETLPEGQPSFFQQKIMGIPIWGVAIGGALILYLITQLSKNTVRTNGFQSGGVAGDTNAGARDTEAITNAIAGYSETTGQQFSNISEDVNTKLTGNREFQEKQFKDITQGLAGIQAAQQGGFKSTIDTLNANIGKSSAEERKTLQAIDKRLTELSAAETRRDARDAEFRQATIQRLNQIFSAVKPGTVQVVR